MLEVVCGGLRWFAVVWPFFNGTRSYRRIIVPNSGGDLWWFAVVCGGLWWFVVICGGLSFSHTQIHTHINSYGLSGCYVWLCVVFN